MFRGRQRLSRAAFPKANKLGKRVHTPHFTFVTSTEATGYAVVVAKAVARLSVTRHRVKRQVSALLHAHKLPPSLIVHARAGASTLPAAELRAEIEAGLAKIA